MQGPVVKISLQNIHVTGLEEMKAFKFLLKHRDNLRYFCVKNIVTIDSVLQIARDHRNVQLT